MYMYLPRHFVLWILFWSVVYGNNSNCDIEILNKTTSCIKSGHVLLLSIFLGHLSR